MRRANLIAILTVAFALAFAMPAQAASAKKVSSHAKTEETTSSSSSSSTTTAAAPKPASKQIEVESISSSGISSKGVLDVYFKIVNKGKYDDAITGVESSVSDKVVLIGMVTPPPAPPSVTPPKTKETKETKGAKEKETAKEPPKPEPKEGEVPNIPLPKDKTVSLSEGEQFVHITGIEKAPKEGTPVQVTLHFRSAPNVVIDVPLKKSSSIW